MIKRVSIAAVTLFSLLVMLTPLAHADVNNFIITNFRADETLSQKDPQGTLHVIEHINVTFSDFNHGIIRAIPANYKGNSLKFHLNNVSSDSGAPTTASKSTVNGNVQLKIGDPNRTVTGPQSYTIDYTLDNVISFNQGHMPELYWDVNGDQWSQHFDHASVRVHLPQGILRSNPAPVCFAGSYGSTTTDCTISVKANTLTASADNLDGYQTLTYVAAFNSGSFHPTTAWERIHDYLPMILAGLTPPLIAAIAGFCWWYRRGRDAPGRGTIVPQYTPPKGITPLAAGTIADFKVDNKDITATIVDLARRGYMTIIEQTKDRILLPDVRSYSLKRGPASANVLDQYETKLLETIFGDSAPGTTIKLDDLKNKFYKAATSIRKDISKQLTRDGYFRADPTKYGVSFAVVYIVAWFGGFFLVGALHLSTALFIGLLLATIIIIGFARAMPARTALGTDIREQLLGLKVYMNTAEKDRLAMLEAPGARYATNSGAPERTVELFESLLPYAIVLGVENQWAAEFKNIYNHPPDWYNGNINAFSAGYLVGSLNSGFAPAVNASFSAPSSSGSSGFSGGFSGGGGGGGGGGGW